MSILFRRIVSGQLGNPCRVLSTTQARDHQWFPDLKPGPYPRTKEEREAAAKKYNLLPEEYEPYPEDGENFLGDYPKLPTESIDSKDPWYPWDNEELRRDFGEPVPIRSINLFPEATSTGPVPVSHAKGTLIFLGLVASVLSLALFLNEFKVITPVMEQQLVTPGVTHYTFDIVKTEDK